MDLITVIKELATGGFATFLIAIIIAGWKRIWIWSYVYDEMIKEKNAQIEHERAEKEEWKAHVFKTKELTDRTLHLAEKVVGNAP